MKIIDDLIISRDQTIAYYELPEEKLHLSYGPGKWCIKEILHHLADAETILYERIRRPIAEPNPHMWVIAQDDWCAKLDYKNTPLDYNKEVYAAIRNAVISMAKRFYDSHGHLTYTHSTMGVRTVKDEFDKIVWHNQEHLRQIELALSYQ